MHTPDKAKLETLGIRPFEQDIRSMTGPELVRHFGAARGGRLVTTRLLRNLIYQVWGRIRRGEEPVIKGNVRSLWYRFVKPTVLRVPELDRNCQAPDSATSRVLAELVEEHRLFDYEDFGFTDAAWRNRAVGLLRPHVLMFAEKTAHVRLLARVQRQVGASFVALGGAPGACTSEYTAKELMAAMPGGPEAGVALVGLVDYDPAGAIIARAFADQLRSFGLQVASLTCPLRPALYSAAELAAARLPQKDGARCRTWLAVGGGPPGAAWGLSVESLPERRLEALMRDTVLGLAPEPQPVVQAQGQAVDRQRLAGATPLRAADLGPALLADVAQGKEFAIVSQGRVVAWLSPEQTKVSGLDS